MRKIMSFILVYLLLFSTTVIAKNYKFDNNVFGVPGTSSDLFLRHQDGGYLRKTFGGDWFSSADGVNEKKFGSGSGGGAQNFFENGDAESGTVNWNDIGAATLTTFSGSPINGTNSFRWDATAQNDIVRTDEIIIPEKFKGQACQIEFFYTGGTDDLVKPQVTDSSNVVLPGVTYKNQVDDSDFLQAQTGIVQRAIGFICPSSGNIKFQFNQTEAGNPASMDFDDVYIGEAKGLSQSVLPDICSARISNAGSASITSQQGDCFSGAVRDSQGIVTLTFSQTYVVIPSILVTVEKIGSDNRICAINAISTTATTIKCEASGDQVSQDEPFSISVTKQGADAQQSVQVLTLAPKISENINRFSARVDGDGTPSVITENVDFIDGAPVDNGVGDYTLNFVSGIFSLTPSCTCTTEASATEEMCSIGTISNTAVQIFTRDDPGTASDATFAIHCDKQASDHKTPTVQTVLVNQVETSLKTGITSESCRIDNTGTPAIDSSSGLCASWISIVGDVAQGRTSLTLVTGTFSSKPICVAIPSKSAGADATIGIESDLTTSSFIQIRTQTASTNGDADFGFNIQCTGKR